MKNKQALFFLFSANTISGIAQGISMIAIPWYFSDHFGLPTQFKWVYFATTFLSMFWSPYSGTLVDKYNRKHIMLGITAAGATLLLSMAALGYHLGSVLPWMAATIFGSTFLIYNIHYPNLYAFAQEITERKDYGRITSYLEIVGQSSSAMAGMLAAILLEGTENGLLSLFGFSFQVGFNIEPWTLKKILLVDGLTYIVGLALISRIRFTPIAIRTADPENVKQRIIKGFTFLQRNPLLMVFGVSSFMPFVGILLTNFYLIPEYVHKHLEESGDVFGAYEGYFALGSLMAGLFIHRIFDGVSKVRAIAFLSVMIGGAFVTHFFNSDLVVFYAVAVVMGLCNAGIRILRVTYFFNHISNQIIGRTSSVFFSINVLFRLLFTACFAMPFFAQGNNIIYTQLILGIFVFCFAGLLLVYRSRLENVDMFNHE